MRKIVKIIMVIVFVTFGLIEMAFSIWGLIDRSLFGKLWVPIVNLIFGAMLLTSPYFLKK